MVYFDPTPMGVRARFGSAVVTSALWGWQRCGVFPCSGARGKLPPTTPRGLAGGG